MDMHCPPPQVDDGLALPPGRGLPGLFPLLYVHFGPSFVSEIITSTTTSNHLPQNFFDIWNFTPLYTVFITLSLFLLFVIGSHCISLVGLPTSVYQMLG